jgi:extracellular matrix regulatory protein A
LAAKLLNVGFGNMVAVARVIAIVDPGSAPMKRLKDEAKRAGKLVDATNGRRTRSVIVTDSDHVVLSAIQTETIAQRVEADALSGRMSKGLRAE